LTTGALNKHIMVEKEWASESCIHNSLQMHGRLHSSGDEDIDSPHDIQTELQV
jgi:hypothetical protein